VAREQGDVTRAQFRDKRVNETLRWEGAYRALLEGRKSSLTSVKASDLPGASSLVSRSRIA